MVFEKLELEQFWNFYAFILVLNIFWNIFLVWPQVAPESSFYRISHRETLHAKMNTYRETTQLEIIVIQYPQAIVITVSRTHVTV